MAFVFVDDAATANGGGGGVATLAQAFPGSVAVGDLLVAHVCWGGTATAPSSITDTLGNTYTAATAVVTDAANSQYQRTYYAVSASAGANTVTAHYTATSSFCALNIARFTGQDATTPLEAGSGILQTAPGTGANAVSSPSQTPAENGALIVGFAQNTNNATSTFTAGTGFTALTQTTGQICRGEYQIQATAAAISAKFTLSAATRTLTSIVVFKPASGGGGGATPKIPLALFARVVG